MTRAQLEHILRAAADIAEDSDIVVFGSQAILGQFPHAPPALLISVEADVFPRNHPDRADLVDGSIGEGSPFHATFGYYAQGIAEQTAILPHGWKDRLVPVSGPNTRGATGWCLEPHDLVVSKLVAGREKDHTFCRAALEHRLVDGMILRVRLAETDLTPELRQLVEDRLDRLVGSR